MHQNTGCSQFMQYKRQIWLPKPCTTFTQRFSFIFACPGKFKSTPSPKLLSLKP